MFDNSQPNVTEHMFLRLMMCVYMCVCMCVHVCGSVAIGRT